MSISFKLNEVNPTKYNFIVSNLILSKTGTFTYYDIIDDLKNMLGENNKNIEYVVQKALIRLREDGFLSILGSNYRVINFEV